MSLRKGNTIIAGSLDIVAVKQEVYDGLFPIGYIYIGVQQPPVPLGVVANWQLLPDHDEALWLSSTDELNTIKNESASIGGTALTSDQLPAHTHRVSQYTITEFAAEESPGKVDNSLVRYGYNDPVIESPVDSGSTGQGHTHTHTIGSIKPKRLILHAWERVGD